MHLVKFFFYKVDIISELLTFSWSVGLTVPGIFLLDVEKEDGEDGEVGNGDDERDGERTEEQDEMEA